MKHVIKAAYPQLQCKFVQLNYLDAQNTEFTFISTDIYQVAFPCTLEYLTTPIIIFFFHQFHPIFAWLSKQISTTFSWYDFRTQQQRYEFPPEFRKIQTIVAYRKFWLYTVTETYRQQWTVHCTPNEDWWIDRKEKRRKKETWQHRVV